MSRDIFCFISELNHCSSQCVFRVNTNVHDHVISLRGGGFHSTSLTPPHLNEVLCVRGIDFAFFYWILILIRQCGIYIFHIINCNY